MAVDFFLKIEGAAVDGESKDKAGHAKEIDLLAWSFGASNSGTAHQGTGAGSGKVNVQDLSVTKYIDSASTKLLLACCAGTHYDKATLVCRKAGDTPLEYWKMVMEEVIITSYSTGGSGGEDRLTENVSLNFAKFAIDYTPQADKGGKGTAIPMTWDIAGNVK